MAETPGSSTSGSVSLSSPLISGRGARTGGAERRNAFWRIAHLLGFVRARSVVPLFGATDACVSSEAAGAATAGCHALPSLSGSEAGSSVEGAGVASAGGSGCSAGGASEAGASSASSVGPPTRRPASESAAGSSSVEVVADSGAMRALSSPGSRSWATVLPAPAEKAAPAKKSVANARLAASRRGATRILRRLEGITLSTPRAAASRTRLAVVLLKSCLRCGIPWLQLGWAPGPLVGADLLAEHPRPQRIRPPYRRAREPRSHSM